MTWSNGQESLNCTLKRLDCALANACWRTEFASAAVRSLPRTTSNHSSIIIHVAGISLPPVNKPFRTESAWFLHKDFKDLVKSVWNSSLNFMHATNKFQQAASKWNKNIFCNVFHKKKRILARLNGIQKSLDGNINTNLVNLESKLKLEYIDILNQEEQIWLQKSCMNWHIQGERNTKFFHTTTLVRRARNKINTLLVNNVWVSDEDSLKRNVREFFINMFNVDSSYANLVGNEGHSTMCGALSDRDRDFLSLPLTEIEIKKAIFQMKPLKAPGPDGLQPVFFQKIWQEIGDSLCLFVKECYSSGNFPSDYNKVLITLIPKIDSPRFVSDFRPISLCNVSYKTPTKVLVNRIRPYLKAMVGPFQSSFLLGRRTIDNVIITQEVINSLKFSKDKKGGMIAKIDLEKAYDKIDWNFLKQTLIDFNMPINWVNIIMSCVMGASLSLLWNGSKLSEFSPGRGLRQGDPLSPYLFVLCMEKLSHMIIQSCMRGDWRGLKASKNGRVITYLFYADDLILFSKAEDKDCSNIFNILKIFCDISGQLVNFKKSKLFCSKSVPFFRAQALSAKMGIPLTNDLGAYLGLPLVHKNVFNNHYKFIIDKVHKKLSNWKAKSLSVAGRHTLIKSVTSAIPSHVMQVAKLPMGICDRLDKMNRDFLWGRTKTKRKIYLINWDTVCKNKSNGGLGIRKAFLNNMASIKNGDTSYK